MAEFQRISEVDEKKSGVLLRDDPYFWLPFPVEYKRGKLRKEEGYIAQLCAQALYLEEMLNAVTKINRVIWFYEVFNQYKGEKICQQLSISMTYRFWKT